VLHGTLLRRTPQGLIDQRQVDAQTFRFFDGAHGGAFSHGKRPLVQGRILRPWSRKVLIRKLNDKVCGHSGAAGIKAFG